MNGLFVTGTDTDVGKTLVSAIITLGTKGTYWKPIQTGFNIDSAWIQEITQLPSEHFSPESYHLSAPLSPHAAAEIDGVIIATNAIKRPAVISKLLIVEGAGGLLVPINKHEFMVDLIRHLELPVLLVARSGLGTINHTLLSLRVIRQLKIPCLGVVLNGKRNRANKEAIEQYGKVEVVAEIEPLPTLNRETLQATFDRKLSYFIEDFMSDDEAHTN